MLLGHIKASKQERRLNGAMLLRFAVVGCRDSAVSSSTSLRSGSPLPGIVEGSTTAGADSARGFGNVNATPQSPKAPSTPGHSRASTPMPSAAASLSSNSSNGFALSVDDDEDDAEGLEVLGLKRADMNVEVGHSQDAQYAAPAARRKLDMAELPQGWRQQPQPQQLQPAVLASSNGGKYSGASSNGNGSAKVAAAQNGSGNGAAPASEPQLQQQQQQQLVGAANDIVPLGSKMSSDRVPANGSSSNKVQQTASTQ